MFGALVSHLSSNFFQLLLPKVAYSLHILYCVHFMFPIFASLFSTLLWVLSCLCVFLNCQTVRDKASLQNIPHVRSKELPPCSSQAHSKKEFEGLNSVKFCNVFNLHDWSQSKRQACQLACPNVNCMVHGATFWCLQRAFQNPWHWTSDKTNQSSTFSSTCGVVSCGKMLRGISSDLDTLNHFWYVKAK